MGVDEIKNDSDGDLRWGKASIWGKTVPCPSVATRLCLSDGFEAIDCNLLLLLCELVGTMVCVQFVFVNGAVCSSPVYV